MRSFRVIKALLLRADTFSFILSRKKNATQFFREFTAKQTLFTQTEDIFEKLQSQTDITGPVALTI